MSNEHAPWFRLRGDRWKADTRGLTLQEKAVFMDLLVEMHEREEPLSDEWLDQIRSITRTRPSTFWPAIERLVSLDLFVRVDGGLWSFFMEHEIEARRGRSDKARRNSEKSRQKSAQNPKNQQGKSQQKQRSSSAIHTDTYTEAPLGASVDRDNPKREDFDNEGASSAYAGSPHTGGDEYPSFAGDVEDQPDWIAEIPMPKSPDDYLAGEKPFPADDPSFAGHKTTATADADASDLHLLDRCERQADWLPEFEEFLIVEMRQTLDAGHDLTAGQKRLLRDEILPLVRELERQPGPPEIAWESKGGENAANGETNAPAS